jgi:hypothetical protein
MSPPGSHAHPLVAVEEQRPQIQLLGGRHPDRRKSIFE